METGGAATIVVDGGFLAGSPTIFLAGKGGGGVCFGWVQPIRLSIILLYDLSKANKFISPFNLRL